MAESNNAEQSSVSEFHLFSSLPQEIRHLIWLETMRPRLVRFFCAKYDVDPNEDDSKNFRMPNSDWLLPITGEPAESSQGRAVRLTAHSMTPVISLTVCQESRNTALRQGGYRAWKVNYTNGGTGDLMWSPVLDTVAIIEPNDIFLPYMYYDMFLSQFPKQAMEMRSFLLPPSLWNGPARSKLGSIVPKWLDLKNLRELMMVLNARFEVNILATPGMHEARREENELSVIPETFKRSLEELTTILLGSKWSPPKVRLSMFNERFDMGKQKR